MCDHPGCGADIDRGLAYRCGGSDLDDTTGCHLFFCSDHGGGLLCGACRDGADPFAPTPDTPAWVTHMLTDGSWAEWRDENPAVVTVMREELDR